MEKLFDEGKKTLFVESFLACGKFSQLRKCFLTMEKLFDCGKIPCFFKNFHDCGKVR